MMGQYFDLIAVLILFGYVWESDPLLIALIPVAFVGLVGILLQRVFWKEDKKVDQPETGTIPV